MNTINILAGVGVISIAWVGFVIIVYALGKKGFNEKEEQEAFIKSGNPT